jgi:hypothetical protein
MSAKEYRDYAAECIDSAKTARSEKERLTFIEMANTWLQAATAAERANAPAASDLAEASTIEDDKHSHAAHGI